MPFKGCSICSLLSNRSYRYIFTAFQVALPYNQPDAKYAIGQNAVLYARLASLPMALPLPSVSSQPALAS